ncbi:MAG: endonuclease/exonuclease/phosphatase family protein, partial [Vibrionaceae bacterium]
MNKKWRFFRSRGFFLALLFLLLAVILFIFIAVTAPEENYFLGMQDKGSCVDFTNQQKNSIDVEQLLTVSVWNIYKQKNIGWQEQLKVLQKSSDLILLQEAKSNNDLFSFFKAQEWNMQQTYAFSVLDNVYGVLNTSKYHPLKACAYKEKEPFLRLPKS